MFRKLTPGAPTLWKPKNQHSVEYLKYLHDVLVKHERITENNRGIIIEALRSITEILIWGDQNDSSVFDFFLERQMLMHFVNIMKQRCGGFVIVQLLQTLNILFENIRSETALYFLLSNNHINAVISHSFDFDNEELLAYYVSFIKTLSFKLNSNTIHFFFNETTREFPLFTEALKFYNHSESMVRIAVRTVTLNIFRLKDESMLNFVVSRARDYFTVLAKDLARQTIEMDTFARSAQNEATNRDRLRDMIDLHLDSLTYINDVLSIMNDDLNTALINSFIYFLVCPLYLASLASLRERATTTLISRVSALFLLAQTALTLHNAAAVSAVLTPLFFGDENDVRSHWMRHPEKGLYVEPTKIHQHPIERLFFKSHLNALVSGGDDQCTLYALLLIYAICQNQAATSDLLEAAQIPCASKSASCDSTLAENLVEVLEKTIATDTSLRPITLELCCIVIRGFVIAMDDESSIVETIVTAGEKVQRQLAERLSGSVFTDDLFLEMFEEESYNVEHRNIRTESISMNAGLYLPPSTTPLSKISLAERLPCGNEERIRRSLQFYFSIRKLMHDLSSNHEDKLPFDIKNQTIAELDDCINLNNCDLLACYVSTGTNEKVPRFLVTDRHQLILVEPDKRKLGWAVVRFSGLLQDTHVSGDPNDGQTLHVVVEDVKCRIRSKASPQLSARLIFDDHIRCMAAKQRLSKGRKTSRQAKLEQVATMLGGGTTPLRSSTSAASPSIATFNRSAGGLIRVANAERAETQIPDDPAVSSPGRIKHI